MNRSVRPVGRLKGPYTRIQCTNCLFHARFQANRHWHRDVPFSKAIFDQLDFCTEKLAVVSLTKLFWQFPNDAKRQRFIVYAQFDGLSADSVAFKRHTFLATSILALFLYVKPFDFLRGAPFQILFLGFEKLLDGLLPPQGW